MQTMRLFRTKSGASPLPDDPDPNVTAPAAGTTLLLAASSPCSYQESKGFLGKLVFTGGTSPTADVEVWVRNEATGDAAPWSFAGSLLAIGYADLFKHDGIGCAQVFLRLVNITVGVTAIQCWALEL